MGNIDFFQGIVLTTTIYFGMRKRIEIVNMTFMSQYFRSVYAF